MSEPLPLSVWAVAQESLPSQRKDRYLPDSVTHSGDMLPALARHAIESYTRPGDIVLDPMCGLGTTLVEAIHFDRHAIGIEPEQRWADLARANVELARSQGATGVAKTICGDSRSVASLVDRSHFNEVALVLTSFSNNALSGVDDVNCLLAEFAETLRGCQQLLRPGGLVVVVTRPMQRNGRLCDLPGAVVRLASDVGLEPFERDVALLCAVRGEQLLQWSSDVDRDSRVDHDDLVILRKSKTACADDGKINS